MFIHGYVVLCVEHDTSSAEDKGRGGGGLFSVEPCTALKRLRVFYHMDKPNLTFQMNDPSFDNLLETNEGL